MKSEFRAHRNVDNPVHIVSFVQCCHDQLVVEGKWDNGGLMIEAW